MISQHFDLEFHARRAQAELDLARAATSTAAANAHLGLSRLHSEKLRAAGCAAPMEAAGS